MSDFDVISMPDSWEYPWYAAWELAFHAATFALIDPGFAKAQFLLLTREGYMCTRTDNFPPTNGPSAT